MSNPFHLLVGTALLFLAGCQLLPTQPDSPPPSETKRPPLPFRSQATPPGEIDADLMFNYLAGEIGAQRGDRKAAYQHLIAAAEQAKDPVAAAQAARLAIKDKRWSDAAAATRLWIEYAPNSLPARQLATILALRQQQLDEARRQAEAILKISAAQGKDGFLQLATVLAGEKLDDKVALMQSLAQSHADDAHAWYGLALVASQRKRFELAEEALNKAEALDPSWEKPKLLRAQLAHLQGDMARAEAVLRTAIEQRPSAVLYQALGRLLMQQNKFDQAVKAFQAAAKLAPQDDDIRVTLGVLAIETQDWDLARASWQRLTRSEDDNRRQQAWYFLGQIEELQENDQAAIDYYEKVKSGRFVDEARLRRAILIGKRGNLEAASRLFREIRLSQPRLTTQSFIAEAQLYREAGQLEKALEIYDEAIAANPANTELLYARGLLAAELGRIDQAEKDFKAILAVTPNDVDALNALGYTLADQTDRYEEAYDYIRRAYEQNPDSAAILDSMGWVLYRMGKKEQALMFLRKAAAKLDDGEISAHLGEVLWSLGRPEAAREVWKKALEFDPDNPKLKETIKRFE